MSSDTADDERVALSAETLAVLQSFLAERKEAEEASKKEAEDKGSTLKTSEDWQLSQFWYSAATAEFLAREVQWCLDQCGGGGGGKGMAVFLSSPSAYKAFRSLRGSPSSSTEGSSGAATTPPSTYLFEYDRRFAVFDPEFVFYDYNTPLECLPAHLLKCVDVVLLDPPFLNEECLAAFAQSVKALARPGAKVLLASGAVQMRAARVHLGLRPTQRAIEHEAGRLSNPFSLFTNYEHADTLGGWDVQLEGAYEKEEVAGGAVAQS